MSRDWKKLTFYYFADSYINFNSLVTDLFKIYKTRIWMSAINPDSFISPPSAGLSMPSPLGLNTGNAPTGRDSPTDRRRHFNPQSQQSPVYAGDMTDPNRNMFGQMGGRGYPSNAYPPMSMGLQSGLRSSIYPQGMQQPHDAFNPYMSSQYATAGQIPDYAVNGANNRSNRPGHAGTEDWASTFQGLSLGS